MAPSPHGVSMRSASAAIPPTSATVASLIKLTVASPIIAATLITGFAPRAYTKEPLTLPLSPLAAACGERKHG